MALMSERPLHERVSSLRAFVRSFPSLADAAEALQVSVGTLRRNTNLAWATAGALDVIEEQMPRSARFSPPSLAGPAHTWSKPATVAPGRRGTVTTPAPVIR